MGSKLEIWLVLSDMKDRVVIDTDVFIGAWFDNDPTCQELIELVYDRTILLLFSQQTIGELIYVTKNFARYAFDDVEERITFLAHLMDIFYHSHSINTIEQDQKILLKSEDEYDDMFIECAYYGKAQYIITNDKQNGLLKLGEYEGTKIITPQAYIRALMFR
jgi:putative PIN family toxin of toxin-antitoxin system